MPAQSPPYAPAFIHTPPPTVPGMAHANSKPPRPAARARCRATAFAAPPPTRSTSPSTSTAASSPPSLRTSASTPSSAASMFEPSPTTATPRDRPCAQRRSSSTSRSDSGRAKARAGPPVPRVVNRESWTPSPIFMPTPRVSAAPRGAAEPAAPSRLAFRLQAAAGTADLDERRLGVLARYACELECRERGGGVAPVVLTRHGEVELDGLELPGAHDLRHLAQPVLEERAELGPGRERRVVVEIDVEEHGDLRAQSCDRPVRLVSLDDEPAGARTRVAAELGHVAADEEGGIEAEPVEAEGDHRARRRLAVRARDDDRAAVRDELGEEVGTWPPL